MANEDERVTVAVQVLSVENICVSDFYIVCRSAIIGNNSNCFRMHSYISSESIDLISRFKRRARQRRKKRSTRKQRYSSHWWFNPDLCIPIVSVVNPSKVAFSLYIMSVIVKDWIPNCWLLLENYYICMRGFISFESVCIISRCKRRARQWRKKRGCRSYWTFRPKR